MVSLQWAYPADADEGLEWRNDVRIGAFGDRCSVEHLISIELSGLQDKANPIDAGLA